MVMEAIVYCNKAVAQRDQGVIAEGAWLGGNKDELQYRQQIAAEADLCMGEREPVMTEDPSSHQAYRQEAHLLRAGTPKASGLAQLAEEGPPSSLAWPRQGEVGADLADIAARQQNLALPSWTQPSTQLAAARYSAGDMTATDLSGFVTPPHLAPAQAEFSVGSNVLYWSETHTTEMEAKVEKVNKDADGKVTSYDLDCKRNAQVSKVKLNHKAAEQPYHFGGVQQNALDHEQPHAAPDKLPEMMREVPSPTPGVNAALGGAVGCLAAEKPLSYGGAGVGAGLLEAPSPAVPTFVAPAPAEVYPRFDVGESVLYWSDTFSQWMPAQVTRVRDGGSYDLDVKKGAQAKKMKRNSESAVSQPAGATAAQAAADAAQGQMAPRAALAASPLGQGPAPPRVLSPLSGRGRGAEGAEDASRQVASGAMAAQAGRPRLGAPAIAAPTAASSLGAGAGMRSTTNVTPALTDAASAASAGQVALRQAVQPVNGAAGQGSTVGQVQTSAAPRTSVGGASPQRLRGTPGGRSETPSAPGMTAGHAGVAAAAIVAGVGTPPAGQALMKAANGGYNVVRQDAAKGVPSGVFMGTGVPGRDFPQAKEQQHNGRSSMSGHRTSLVGGGAVASPGCSSRSRPALEEGTLHIDNGSFNPSNPSVRQQLLNALNVGPHSTIEEMQGFRGGLNEGVWFLGDPAQGQKSGGREELVLKLVKCSRIAVNILTEAENFLEIYKKYPTVVNDPMVAFPLKVFSCIGPAGNKRYDLIIMRKVKGERLAELIARMWYNAQVPRLMQIMEKLGGCLADFHSRYGGSQHGDFQPSNIFCEEERDDIAFIDVGGMGIPTVETDIEHFSKSMHLLADSYGPQLAVDGVRCFKQGYAAKESKRR